MANTTFNGPVRSENGFKVISKNSSTGAITEKKSQIDLEKIRAQALEKVASMETLDDRERSMKLLDVMSKAILQDAQKE